MTERDIGQNYSGYKNVLPLEVLSILAEYDIHPDGVTMLPEVIRNLCEDKLTVDELTSQALVI